RLPPGRNQLESLVELFQSARDRRLGCLLHGGVDGREHAETALIHPLPAKALDQLDPDLLLEVLTEGLARVEAILELDARLAGRFPGRLVNGVTLEHGFEN